MAKLRESYVKIYTALQNIMDEYRAVENQYRNAGEMDERTRAARIAHFEKQLEKIEEYRPKVDFYRKLAEKHMESKNLLATEGMDDIIGQPRELNFKHMHDWATYIDPTNSDDPYAQRIYVMAKCNEIYLDRKQKQFEESLAALKDNEPDSSLGVEELKEAERNARRKTEALLSSPDWNEFTDYLKEANHQNNDLLSSLSIKEKTDPDSTVLLGLQENPLPVVSSAKSAVSSSLGVLYDMQSGTVKLPLEMESEKENIIIISNNLGKEKKVYRGLQNYLIQRINLAVPGLLQIHVADAVHYNNTILGPLRALENNGLINDVPSDSDKLADSLKEVISEYIEIDEQLGVMDSVGEYNSSHEQNEQIPRHIVIAVGYPSSFSGEAMDIMNRIILNHEHYGTTVILCDTRYHEKSSRDERNVTETMRKGVMRITLSEEKEQITVEDNPESAFSIYELNGTIPQEFADAYLAQMEKDASKGNEYFGRIEFSTDYPDRYERGRKQISLEYGVKPDDELSVISFDNENFATFLMGASGSGKSTLLHTLITGILRNYHPDDVELWLADFKMAEFSQYIKPMPPHVKYILLDESAELVYDLIDKLTEKMMERQRYFMQHRDIKKVEDVPVEKYMPVIFIILDEFSIMSQAVAESEEYKLKLQNLLAKGRALGIKFLFSSQTFVNGISGLTRTAKEQIQSRLAMKNSREEINETLELTASMKTDRVRSWMEALPPHYALYKYREDDRIQIERVKVLYFAGKGSAAYQPQRDLISMINDSLKADNKYHPEDIRYYVDKQPVIVDGNSYSAFDNTVMKSAFETYRTDHRGEYSAEDTLFVLGVPRLMENWRMSAFTCETRENLLFITKPQETSQSASILMSIAKSFKLQNRNVEIWAYGRNRLYREFKKELWNQFDVFENEQAVSDRIEQLHKSLQAGSAGNHLIIMLGMERIVQNFEISPQTKSVPVVYQSNVAAAAAATTKQEMDLNARASAWTARQRNLNEQYVKEGKTQEEIKELLKIEMRQFFKNFSSAIKEKPEEKQTEKPEEKLKETVRYRDCFETLIKQGSRLGYHFICATGSYVDFRQMEIKDDYFRHRLSFSLSKDESSAVFGSSRAASSLPEHVCYYTNGNESWSLRPYLHEGLEWDGWYVESGTKKAKNAFDEDDKEEIDNVKLR